MVVQSGLPLRSRLLPSLHQAHAGRGYLTRDDVALIAAAAQVPVAEAWAVARSYPDFHFDAPAPAGLGCGGLACRLALGDAPSEDLSHHCAFRCYEAPAPAEERVPDDSILRACGPLLAGDPGDWAGLEAARAIGPAGIEAHVDAAGVRGRGGAYFPVARKWRTALDEGRPIALVMNAEEGEPGVFKDRALLALRPRRVLEGLAIAAATLRPSVVIVFINGAAMGVRDIFERTAAEHVQTTGLSILEFFSGGGGYVLGEDTTMVNAIEGQRAVPRPRPPFPAERGLFGMPTVVSNVESFAALSVALRGTPEDYRAHGTADAPGTKLFSISGAVDHPGIYELDLGVTIRDVAKAAGGDGADAVLAGGPSGGFLPANEFDRALAPGSMHETGAVLGAGGLTFLTGEEQLRMAVAAMIAFNRDESCGKCTPCREGTHHIETLFVPGASAATLDDLWQTVRLGSLCGLGQMATGPGRSARHFWPELFA